MDTAPNPVPAYVASLLRAGLTALGGWLVSKGYITADHTPEIVGAGLTVVAVVWSLIQKANAHAALKDAIAAPAGKAQ